MDKKGRFSEAKKSVMDGDLLFKNLSKRSWIILFLLGSTSALLLDRSFTTGVILGGFIAIGSFSALQHTVRRAFAPKRRVKTSISMIATLAKFFFRFLVMAAILFFLIGRGWADTVGLAVGLSTVVFSIVSFGISSAFKSGTREAT